MPLQYDKQIFKENIINKSDGGLTKEYQKMMNIPFLYNIKIMDNKFERKMEDK